MKNPKTVLYILIMATFLLAALTLVISAETAPHSAAKSFALYNPDTDSFLHGRNMNMRLPMASTTKIITGLIAIEQLEPDRIIRITDDAVGVEGSSIYLSAGDELTAEQLTYALLLQSANDAAVALAIEIGGTVDGFADIMNERAEEIGAIDTHFSNPHGLDDEKHYTTARDLALIAAEAIKNESFKKIASTYKYTLRIGEKSRTIVNHNKLLRSYDGCIGVKTGYTRACGRCLVSAAKNNGITLIAVTLNDPDDWRDHKSLLDYGFDSLKSVPIGELVELPDSLPVINGEPDRIKIGVPMQDCTIITQADDYPEVIEIALRQYVAVETRRGDIVGKITVKTKEYTKTINVIALEDCNIVTTRRRLK